MILNFLVEVMGVGSNRVNLGSKAVLWLVLVGRWEVLDGHFVDTVSICTLESVKN